MSTSPATPRRRLTAADAHPAEPNDASSPVSDERFARMVTAMQRHGVKDEAPPIIDIQESPVEALERAFALVRSGEVDAGLTWCHQAWPVVSRARDLMHMGVCQYVMAIGYFYNGMYAASLSAGQRGLDLLTRAGEKGRRLHLMSVQAATLANLGRVAEAFELFYCGTQLLPSVSENPEMQCRFWNNATTLYSFIDRDDLALRCTERAAALTGYVDDPVLEAVVLSNLLGSRMAVFHAQDQAAAWEVIQPVYLDLRRHLDALLKKGLLYAAIPMAVIGAAALMRGGRWDEARAVLRVGHKAAASAGMAARRARIELSLAQLERQMGQPRLAIAHVNEALTLLRQQEDPLLLAEVHLENCLLQEAQGRWRVALESLREHHKLREAELQAQAQARAEAVAERVTREGQRIHLELARLLDDAPQAHGGAADATLDAAFDAALADLPDPLEFEQRIAQWQAEQAADAPLVLMICSVDQFKAIGAKFATARRDVMHTVGQLLRKHLRPNDVVAHWANDEFAVGFGGAAPLEESMQAATRLRDIFEQHHWAAIAPQLTVTMSFGLTAFSDGETLHDTLLRAAWALHHAKRSGYSQVRAI